MRLCLTLLWNYLEREGFTVASAHDVVLAPGGADWRLSNPGNVYPIGVYCEHATV